MHGTFKDTIKVKNYLLVINVLFSHVGWANEFLDMVSSVKWMFQISSVIHFSVLHNKCFVLLKLSCSVDVLEAFSNHSHSRIAKDC